MDEPVIYTASDAIDMLRKGGVDLAKELNNVTAAYADITDEIEQAGGEATFTEEEFKLALTEAARGQDQVSDHPAD